MIPVEYLESLGIREEYRVSEHVIAGLERFPFFIQHRESVTKTSYHVHPGIEIDITHEGRGVFLIGHMSERQIPRQVTILAGSLPHRLHADSSKPYRRTVLCIDPNRLDIDRSALMALMRLVGSSWRLETREYIEIDKYCVALHAEMTNKQPEWETAATGILMQIIAALRRSAIRRTISMGREPSGWASKDLVQACRDYVRANLSEPLSLSTLARTFCVSRGHLARTFRQELGVTVHEYLTAERLSEAKRLIATQREMSITEIALHVGYQSLSHFSRAFRQHVGFSPAAYRKRLGHA